VSGPGPVPRIKEAHCAGRWYPADGADLDRLLGRLLVDTCRARPGCLAVLVPHGAYEHSGRTAAYGYAAASDRFRRRVIILAPSHHTRFRGAALLGMDGYRTPLDVVPIDKRTSAALAQHPLVRTNPALFMREHAIEVQLPFLQRMLPELAVVPMLVGELDADARAALADVLRPLLVPENLVVVSSDLVHYGRRFDFLPVPPTDADSVRGAVRTLDDGALEHLLVPDADRFERFVADTGATICGRHALALLLAALPPGIRGERLAYATSLGLTGDYESTVSYAAVSFAPPPG
jgi:AmmeMemoRadiSam system protein B